jgi:hypothetical protein
MMPSFLIRHRTDTCHFGRVSPGNTRACAAPQNCPMTTPQILSSNLRAARSRHHARQSFNPKPPDRQAPISFTNIHLRAKSP